MERPYRIYTREGEEGGRTSARRRVRRFYADLRRFADVGGGREALVPKGETLATADPNLAEALAEERYRALRRARIERDEREKLGLPSPVGLHVFAREHLKKKAEARKVTDAWLTMSELHLERAVQFFGAERELDKIGVGDVEGWTAELRRQGLGGGTVRQHLNTLSNLYRRAQGEQRVPPGYNPVAAMMEKPAAEKAEARFLEVHEAALFLEAARTYHPKREDLAMPFGYELLATFLLTGGRETEVYGLEIPDVNFERRTLTFRPNTWRRLKTSTSRRTVPLWPQLEEVLKAYLEGPTAPRGRLLFGVQPNGHEALLTDCRRFLDAVAKTIKWKAGDVRTKVFRHTYCAARLQTLDRGQPVAKYTVAQELGHGGDDLVKRVYGHLGQIRHRAAVVEYRVEQWAAELGPQLDALRAP